jgi:hypothetical protein
MCLPVLGFRNANDEPDYSPLMFAALVIGHQHRDLKDRIVFLDVRGESTRTVAGFLARLSSRPTVI